MKLFALPLDLPLEVQQTIKKLTGRIEYLEKQNHFNMLSLQSYNKFTLPPPTSLYMEHGMRMRSPINNMNHGTPPVNYTPPYVNYEIPPGAMNMSQDLESPLYSQWPMMNTSEANTTATLVESVATTQEKNLLPFNSATNTKDLSEATTPPIKPIAKVVVPLETSSQYPIIMTENADVPLDDTTKENTPLPTINHDALASPKTVADKYPKLLVRSKIPTLAVKLANEAFFGPKVMSYCTFQGVGSYHALPQDEVKKMKEFLFKISFPAIVSSRIDFEDVWRKCIESVGQKCKKLRKRRLANLELK